VVGAADQAPVPADGATVLFDQGFLKQLERLRLAGQRAAAAPTRGLQLHTRAGRSLEIMDYRNYRPGDDLRYLDWNAYSRLNQLVVKVFAAERNRDLHMVVDRSVSMALGNVPKFDLARQIAAACAYIGLGHLESVWLHSFGASRGPSYGPQPRRKSFKALLSFLERLDIEPIASGTTDAGAALGRLAHELPRPALIMVVSDLLSVAGVKPALRALSARGHELMVVHVMAKDDVLPTANGFLRLSEQERGEHLDAFVDEDLRKTYRAVVQDFMDNCAHDCRAARARYLATTSDVPFNEVVLRLMRSSGLLQ
jgi:uncharacterized protein (DUF58 family)